MDIQTLFSRLPYADIFGGATILNEEHMQKINGFPNIFFGWGGEDDNINSRYICVCISRHTMLLKR